jgi:hypothetical protein
MRLWTYGFGALFLSAGGALFLTQCGDSNLGTPGDLGGDAAASCPTNPPTSGTACSLPSGTTCSNYPQPGCECCAEVGGICQNGTWQPIAAATPNSGGNNITAACPTTLPDAGSACTAYVPGGCGAPPEQDCSFNCPRGGQLYAVCGGGSWQISGSCDDDAGLDGGDGG